MADGDTIKTLVDMLISMSSSSASMLEKLDQFKNANDHMTELRSTVSHVYKMLDRMPSDVLTGTEANQIASDMFAIVRGIQSKVDRMEDLTKNIEMIRDNIRAMDTTVINLIDSLKDITTTCPLEDNMQKINKSVDDMTDDANGLLSKISSLGNDIIGLRLQMAASTVVPKWIWMIIGILAAVAFLAWIPKAALWFLRYFH